MFTEFVAAVLFVTLVRHRHITALTEVGVVLKELLVSALQYVDFREKELWVDVHVETPVYLSQSRVHLWAALLTELTMENDHSTHQALDGLPVSEEVFLHLLGVTQIKSAFDVSPTVFVIEAAIYDH